MPAFVMAWCGPPRGPSLEDPAGGSAGKPLKTPPWSGPRGSHEGPQGRWLPGALAPGPSQWPAPAHRSTSPGAGSQEPPPRVLFQGCLPPPSLPGGMGGGLIPGPVPAGSSQEVPPRAPTPKSSMVWLPGALSMAPLRSRMVNLLTWSDSMSPAPRSQGRGRRSSGCLPWPLPGGSTGLTRGVSPGRALSGGLPGVSPFGTSPGVSSLEEHRKRGPRSVLGPAPRSPARTSFCGPPPDARPGRAPLQRLLGALRWEDLPESSRVLLPGGRLEGTTSRDLLARLSGAGP